VYLLGALVFTLSVALFLLSLPFGPITKCCAVSSWVACVGVFLKFGVRGVEFETFSRAHIVAAGVAMIVSASCYLGLLNDNRYVYDWAKHRAVLLSLYERPFSPTIAGFDLQSTNVASDAPLVYYYAPYMLPVMLVKLTGIGQNPAVEVTV